MPQADLTRRPEQVINTSADTIVIVELIEDIPGGRTLDTAGFTVAGAAPEVIKGGHVIIEETATKVHKPLSTNAAGDAYAALPAGHKYKGVLFGTILTADPRASIMVRGRVNTEAATNAQGLPAYPAAAVTALPLINFAND